METEIEITERLYICRNVAKQLAARMKEDYTEMLAPYTHIIKEVMKKNNLKEIPALLKIDKTNVYRDSGMAQLLFMAATTELIEPSEE